MERVGGAKEAHRHHHSPGALAPSHLSALEGGLDQAGPCAALAAESSAASASSDALADESASLQPRWAVRRASAAAWRDRAPPEACEGRTARQQEDNELRKS